MEVRKARFPGRNTRAYRKFTTRIIHVGNEYLAAVLDRQQIRWQGSYLTYLEAATEAAFNRMNEAAKDWCKAKFGECYSVEFRGDSIYVEY
jgi:hypothetical protein